MGLVERAQERLGECFILGFDGFTLSEETAALLTQAQIGGVILFSRNYQNPKQVATLITQIQECRASRPPLWISVDQEGGRVQRFKEGFTKIPTAKALGATNSPKLIFEIAEAQARELAAVGINVNFCPVADIMTNPQNPVIGDRAYGSDEALVTKMVSSVVRGHVVAGVQPCLKHFPGHGDTNLDSHFALPHVATDLKTLKEREFRPFSRGIRSRCAMIMTAHVILEKIEPKLPATLSKKILQELLREELRYDGLIISDDLEMQAITDHFGAETAPKMALEAGCDLLIYRSEKQARAAYNSLSKQLANDALDPSLVLRAAERSENLKMEVLANYAAPDPSKIGPSVSSAENVALMERVGSP